MPLRRQFYCLGRVAASRGIVEKPSLGTVEVGWSGNIGANMIKRYLITGRLLYGVRRELP